MQKQREIQQIKTCYTGKYVQAKLAKHLETTHDNKKK